MVLPTGPLYPTRPAEVIAGGLLILAPAWLCWLAVAVCS